MSKGLKKIAENNENYYGCWWAYFLQGYWSSSQRPPKPYLSDFLLDMHMNGIFPIEVHCLLVPFRRLAMDLPTKRKYCLFCTQVSCFSGAQPGPVSAHKHWRHINWWMDSCYVGCHNWLRDTLCNTFAVKKQLKHIKSVAMNFENTLILFYPGRRQTYLYLFVPEVKMFWDRIEKLPPCRSE